jgi:hypothetical protein
MTIEELKTALLYNPDTGEFVWKSARPGVVRSIAGYKMKNGYVTICLDQKQYYAHRLAWLYVNGSWPTLMLDHINGDRADNRIANLRLANQTEQNANSKIRKDNSSGIRGVYFAKDIKRWRAQINVRSKWIHLGSFADFEQAKDAYEEAAFRYFGEFKRKSI